MIIPSKRQNQSKINGEFSATPAQAKPSLVPKAKSNDLSKAKRHQRIRKRLLFPLIRRVIRNRRYPRRKREPRGRIRRRRRGVQRWRRAAVVGSLNRRLNNRSRKRKPSKAVTTVVAGKIGKAHYTKSQCLMKIADGGARYTRLIPVARSMAEY